MTDYENLKNIQNIMDPQFFLSLFFYLVFLVLFYFKGLKGDGSGITIFLTIILYIFNIIWFYNKKNIFKINPQKLMPQIILFYFFNLLLLYTYFDPFNNATRVDPTENKLIITDYKPIIFSLISVIGFLSIIIYVFLHISSKKVPLSNYLQSLLKVFGTLIFLAGIISLFMYFAFYTPWILTIVTSILNIFIFILTLSLIYKYLFKKSGTESTSTSTPFGNLLKAYIFYIPCLLISFIEYIKHELKITTKPELLILGIEVIIIGLRFLLPYLYKLYYSHFGSEGDIIEKGPLYLNTKHNLGVVQNHEPSSKIIGNELKIKQYNYNYALSARVWINPQPPSTNDSYNKSTFILDYGEILLIKFHKNKMEFYASTTENDKLTDTLVKIYETKDFYYQKWNNIIFNYNGGTLDIFINNKLVSSSMNITPIIKYNSVTVGSNNGIHGGIKDIIYYNKILTKNDIININNKD